MVMQNHCNLFAKNLFLSDSRLSLSLAWVFGWSMLLLLILVVINSLCA